jgi:hypothetical protein
MTLSHWSVDVTISRFGADCVAWSSSTCDRVSRPQIGKSVPLGSLRSDVDDIKRRLTLPLSHVGDTCSRSPTVLYCTGSQYEGGDPKRKYEFAAAIQQVSQGQEEGQ